MVVLEFANLSETEESAYRPIGLKYLWVFALLLALILFFLNFLHSIPAQPYNQNASSISPGITHFVYILQKKKFILNLQRRRDVGD